MTTQRKASTSNGSPNPKEHALQQYAVTEGHFSLVRCAVTALAVVKFSEYIVRNFRLADLVTIMNGFCGSFSLFYSAHYLLSNDVADLQRALFFPLAGLIFDFFDGKVARWRQSSSLLGQELDSLADLVRPSFIVRLAYTNTCALYQISFGVAPAVLAFAIGLRTLLDMTALTTFICCGLARLARFNATVALVPKDATGKAHYFEGLPIPSSLAIVAVMAYWTKQGWIEGQLGVPGGVLTLWGAPGGPGDIHIVSIIFGAWAAAMVSKTLRVPKP